jgi:hypothetical protein
MQKKVPAPGVDPVAKLLMAVGRVLVKMIAPYSPCEDRIVAAQQTP